jgi:hypothetical protein
MWQRDALRRIIAVGTPNDAAIAELLALCKKEHGATGCDLEPVALEAAHLPANPANGAFVTITNLSDIVGVNQLAPGQTLPFETAGLTIVHGPNGAGKSGYGRVLKRACRARKAGEIMPDAYQPAPAGKATGSFSILKDGVAADPVAWSDTAGPHNVLSAISVFDRDCGSVHVQEKNEVAFRPFGLDIPDDLAGVCQKLKQLLVAEEAQLSAARQPVFATPTWNPTTDVGKILSALAYNTDLATLETLDEMTAEERLRLARLREDLQKNPVEAAATQRLVADDVRRFLPSTDTPSHTRMKHCRSLSRSPTLHARRERQRLQQQIKRSEDFPLRASAALHGGRFGRPRAVMRSMPPIREKLSRIANTKSACFAINR